ncbi:MAG: M28 family peptidase [Haloferacaceae archaeon]
MDDGNAEWIGRTFTSDVGWTHLERLVDVGNRMAGSEGERAGREATREALEAAGARNVRIDEFGVQGWERGTSSLAVGGTEQECIALPRGPAGSATGELVHLGYGLPADFERDIEGAVVVVSSTVPDHVDRFIHRREKYYRAVEGGAAAFVFANHVEGRLAPTGSVGGADAPLGEIPAVGVSKEVGARLERRFEGEEATVTVDCATPAATSGSIHAELGPDTDREVLLTSHVDAHDIAEGAMDNGAGTATLVEVMRALADREDDLETRVRAVAFGAEEVGLVGSSREADRCDPGDLKAVVNLDGVLRGRTLSVATHGFDGLGEAARAVADRTGHPIEVVPEQMPHSDHWPFVERGVPGYMVSGRSEERGRGWGHTRADTIDKLERRDLRESAILLTELVVEVASGNRTVAHRDPSAIASALEREGHAEGMRLTGDWPFDG